LNRPKDKRVLWTQRKVRPDMHDGAGNGSDDDEGVGREEEGGGEGGGEG
jgi:hypothetical protein